MIRVGVVVIGRNEGKRLVRCLESLKAFAGPIVYVDSGSTDASVEAAQRFGHGVVELDLSTPFTAARARNEGFARLTELIPALDYVQFIDGDCTVAEGWMPAAEQVLSQRPECAIVTGHLVELSPDATVYNRLCQLEWTSPSGDLADAGGIGGLFMVRTDAFRAVGGFNPDVIAGEDSELGVRLGLAGWKITRLDRPMAVHDAGITSFRQWWRRSVRAGHAIGQRAFLNGATAARDCVRERRSTIFWGWALPLMSLVLLIPTRGVSLLLLCLYGVLAWRVYRNRRGRGDSPGDAALYAAAMPLTKIANGMGLAKFELNRRAGRFRIIEYK